MDKVSMRKIFMAIVISVMACTVGATNQNHSQNSDIRKFSKTFLVKEKKVKFTVRANFEYPAGNPELEKFIARKLFGNDTSNLEVAFKEYLGKFQSTKEPDYEGEKREYTQGDIYYTTKFLGMQNKNTLLSNVIIPDSILLQTERYVPIFCSVSVRMSKQIKSEIIPQSVTYMLTYDKEERRVLNVTDVFIPYTMEKLNIPNSKENTEVMVKPYTNAVAFSTVVNGKKINRQVTISNNAQSFTDRIATMPILSYIEEIKKKKEAEQEKMKAAKTIADKAAADKAIEPDNKLVKVEQMPSFPGGDAELLKWLSKNIRYPAVAEENGVQGTVILRYVVGADGSISNVSIKRSVDPSLDKEAMRVVKAMPNWNPSIVDGKPVPVWFTLPVTFYLQ